MADSQFFYRKIFPRPWEVSLCVSIFGMLPLPYAPIYADTQCKVDSVRTHLLASVCFPKMTLRGWVLIINSLLITWKRHSSVLLRRGGRRGKMVRNDNHTIDFLVPLCSWPSVSSLFSLSPQWSRKVSAVSLFILWWGNQNSRSRSLDSPWDPLCHWGTAL